MVNLIKIWVENSNLNEQRMIQNRLQPEELKILIFD